MASLAGFDGPVYPVHPNAEAVLGRPAFSSVAELPTVPDLALIAVPAAAVAAVVRDCGEAGVSLAVVHAGGFGESGGAGEALQEDLLAAARETGVRVLGPNTSGFLAPHLRLCASFVSPAAAIGQGDIAIVAQSGGVNHALAFAAHAEGAGLRLAVGLGNAVDVGFADVLAHLATDPQTAAVILAIEGVTDGRALYEAVARLTPRTPVVALKVGRSDVNAFAQSHTGVLTGSWKVARAALRQAGAVVVDDTTQLIDAARALAMARLPPHPRPGVGLITGQAGPGLILADALGSEGVELPTLSDEVEAQLRAMVGPVTFVRNPVDTGRPGPGFAHVIHAVAEAPEIDALAMYLLHEPDAIQPEGVLPSAASRGGTPIVLGTAGPPEQIARTREGLAREQIPVFTTPERTAAAVVALVRDARLRHRRSLQDPTPASPPSPPPAGERRNDWDEHLAKQLVAVAGVEIPAGRRCSDHDQAQTAAAQLGFPVVAKLLHPALRHKTEVGAVRIGLRDRDELMQALTAFAQLDVGDGAQYLIEAMAPPGPELLLGVRRDPVFGPLVVLGAGGVDADIHDDIAIRLAPVTGEEAASMLDDLRAAARYDGHRGGPRVDRERLGDVISALSRLSAERSDIVEIEINPLRLTADGRLVALDALVVGRDPVAAGQAPA
jgi:acetyltransferase